jgi:hypothetical protein
MAYGGFNGKTNQNLAETTPKISTTHTKRVTDHNTTKEMRLKMLYEIHLEKAIHVKNSSSFFPSQWNINNI